MIYQNSYTDPSNKQATKIKDFNQLHKTSAKDSNLYPNLPIPTQTQEAVSRHLFTTICNFLVLTDVTVKE